MKITYVNGYQEEESTLIKRCIGMGRQIRKGAALILGVKFRGYQKAERKLMLKEKIFPPRLADSKRRY